MTAGDSFRGIFDCTFVEAVGSDYAFLSIFDLEKGLTVKTCENVSHNTLVNRLD